MKRIMLYIILLLITTVGAFSQQTKSDIKLLKKDGKYMIEYNGKQFRANENILTVKYKESSFIKSNLKILRKNKLGFIDIKVPEGKNIEEYANELKESGLFEIVEFNPHYSSAKQFCRIITAIYFCNFDFTIFAVNPRMSY